MPLQYYILDGKTVIPVSCKEWGDWAIENSPNMCPRVAITELLEGIIVSTIFVGTPFTIFETMIFGGEHDGYQERYATWEEAEAGHQRAIELIFEVQPTNTWNQQE